MDVIWKIVVLVAVLLLKIVMFYYFVRKRAATVRQRMAVVETGTIFIDGDIANPNTNRRNVTERTIEIAYINLPSDGQPMQPPDYFSLHVPPYETCILKENEPPPSYETAITQTD